MANEGLHKLNTPPEQADGEDPPPPDFSALTGLTADEAKARIQKEYPQFTNIQVMAPGQPMTRDFRPDRVRLLTEEDGATVKACFVG